MCSGLRQRAACCLSTSVCFARWDLPNLAQAASFSATKWGLLSATWTQSNLAFAAQQLAEACLQECKAWYSDDGTPDLKELPDLGQDRGRWACCWEAGGP